MGFTAYGYSTDERTPDNWTHATELVNGGVSLATIRKRLGHKNLQTTSRCLVPGSSANVV
jgi:integrase